MSIPFFPRTAHELLDALKTGVLVESLTFDAKADLEPGPRGNARLAVDMAAMAVAGGLIAVGVAEDRDDSVRTLVAHPIALAGLRERISQVGLSRIDPPLHTTTRPLSIQDASATPVADSEVEEPVNETGFLLIAIPPSPDAPHMVDGKYRGRADTTNYVLGDADVRRIQSQRRRAQPDIAQDLRRAIERDPTTPELRQHAHLFVVARPVVATSPTMLQERLGGRWQKWIHTLAETPRLGIFEPDLPSASNNTARRASGWAVSSHVIQRDRTLGDNPTEDELVELEVDEDGSLRLFCGRASDSLRNEDKTRWAFEDLLAGLTWRVIRAAAEVSDFTSYFGNWDMGVALTNARGVSSYAVRQQGRWISPYRYSEETYEQTTQTTYAEIHENRMAVLERLVGRLNRALNDDTIPLRDFDASQAPGR